MNWVSTPLKSKSPRPILEFIIKAGFASLVLGFIYLVVIPNYIGPKRSGPVYKAYSCVNNLRQIDAAKQQWALENGKTNGDIIVTENDIRPYLGRGSEGNIPKCPSGGKYTIGKLKEVPTCSLGSNVNPPHVLP